MIKNKTASAKIIIFNKTFFVSGSFGGASIEN
jgi:hypothetical protein